MIHPLPTGHPDVIHEASTCSAQGFGSVSVALRWSSGPVCAWGRRFCSHTIHGNGIVTRWAPNSYKWEVITPLKMASWIGNLGYFTPTPGVTTILTTGVWAHLVTTFWVSFFYGKLVGKYTMDPENYGFGWTWEMIHSNVRINPYMHIFFLLWLVPYCNNMLCYIEHDHFAGFSLLYVFGGLFTACPPNIWFSMFSMKGVV